MCQENVPGDVLSFFFPDVLHLIFQTLQMTGLCPGLSPLKSSQNRHEMWNTKLMLPRKSSARNPTLISFVSKCLKPIFAEHSTIYRLYNQCLFPVLQAEIRFVSMTKKPGFFRHSKKLRWRNVMELPVVRLLPWFMPPTPTSHWEWQMRRA